VAARDGLFSRASPGDSIQHVIRVGKGGEVTGGSLKGGKKRGGKRRSSLGSRQMGEATAWLIAVVGGSGRQSAGQGTEEVRRGNGPTSEDSTSPGSEVVEGGEKSLESARERRAASAYVTFASSRPSAGGGRVLPQEEGRVPKRPV